MSGDVGDSWSILGKLPAFLVLVQVEAPTGPSSPLQVLADSSLTLGTGHRAAQVAFLSPGHRTVRVTGLKVVVCPAT